MSLEDKLKAIQQSAEEQPPVEEKKPKKKGRKAGSKVDPTTGKVIPPDKTVTKDVVPPPSPDKAIAEILKIPFDIWGDTQELKELKLTNDEALQLSCPVKQLMDYYLPQISPIGYVWVSFGIVTSSIMTKRLKIIADEKQRREEDSPDNGSEGKRKVDVSKKRTAKKK